MVEVSERVIIELLSIVRDKDSRDSEPVNNTSPNEVSDILLCDGGQYLYFYPLGEVVDPYDEELKLFYCRREGSHDVKSPLSERSWSVHWSELFQRLPCNVAKALILVTCLHIGLGVLLHSRPIVSCSYELVNY